VNLPARPIMGRIGLLCVVGSTAVIALTVFAVGAATPGYSPWSDTVSRLGSPGQPHAMLARAGFIAYGLLVMCGAMSLGRRAPGRENLFSALLAGYGAMGVVAGLAPKDMPHTRHTTASQVHVAATIVGGGLLLLAMALVAQRAPTRTDRTVAMGAASIIVLTALIFRFTWGSSIYGLVERVLLATAAFWLTALALPWLITDLRGQR
jgi:hypothetical membrane protein